MSELWTHFYLEFEHMAMVEQTLIAESEVVLLTLKNQHWNFTSSVLLANVIGLSELTGCHSFNWTTAIVCVFWVPDSQQHMEWQQQRTQPQLWLFFFFLMLRLVSNQAIGSIDGSVSLASCLFVSADKGNAICGRWTLLTLVILWLFVWHWHQCDHCVRKINCQLVPPFFDIFFPAEFFFLFFLTYLSTCNFKSDPNLKYHYASTWNASQLLTLH